MRQYDELKIMNYELRMIYTYQLLWYRYNLDNYVDKIFFRSQLIVVLNTKYAVLNTFFLKNINFFMII